MIRPVLFIINSNQRDCIGDTDEEILSWSQGFSFFSNSMSAYWAGHKDYGKEREPE